jgi:hypothetical protein
MSSRNPEHASEGIAAPGLGWPLTADPQKPAGAAGLGWPTDAPTPSPEERS